MKRKVLALLVAATLWTSSDIAGQTPNSAGPRHITLREAVELALKHNHDVRLAGFSVDEKQHAKEAEKSSYFPSIHNDSILARLTDTQLIQIQAGSLGTVSGTPVPVENSIINQGGRTLTTSGTQITQPLTSLLKIRRPGRG
jgi:outer membrane protein TolC